MGRVMLLLATVTAFAFTTVIEHRAIGEEEPAYFASAVREGQMEWTATRKCRVTADGGKVVVARLGAVTSVMETKAEKYSLSSNEQSAAVKGVVKAYLDAASLEEFGAYRQGCVLTGSLLEGRFLPPLASSPDTGILEVDGSQIGADIFLDGDRKGVIKQAFVLSVGQHKWKTMKCEGVVEIVAKEEKKQFCARK